MTLGEIIKKYREDKNLSQRQFALASGLSNGYISMLENNLNPQTGEPMKTSLSAIKKIADVMGVAANELMVQASDIDIAMEWYNVNKSATIGDGLSAKKQALINAILDMDDSDVDVVTAAAEALIARREK